MRTLLIDEERDAPEIVEAPTPAMLQRRWRLYRLIGVYFAAVGLFLQWLMPTTTLHCAASAAGSASCAVSHRMLVGLVPAGSAGLEGVSPGTRIERKRGIRRARDRTSYHVVLQTSEGEREMTWSSSFDAARRLARTIDEKLRAGAPFEATVGFVFWDWAWRALALLVTAGGAGLFVVGLARYRRSGRPA